MSKKIVLSKNYRVEIPGSKPVVIRTTSTLIHAVKHACFAAELQIRVTVRDNRTDVIVTEFAPIDDEHAIKPKCKRDKRYAKLARKVE